MSAPTLRHSVIVSPEEAIGYLYAAYVLPNVEVGVVKPQDEDERRGLIGEHVGHLVTQHRDSLDDADLGRLVGVAMAGLKGAFDEGAILVRIATPDDVHASGRLDALAVCAGGIASAMLN